MSEEQPDEMTGSATPVSRSQKAQQVATRRPGEKAMLTRSEVARRLSVSISTVRRMEGTKLHPTVDDRGVHLFDAGQVVELAKALAESGDGSRRQRGDRWEPGELAAQVFERFAQRQGLHEIVTALRIEPKTVRRLYREWRTGLEAGLEADDVSRVERSTRDVLVRISVTQLAIRLEKVSPQTRISLAERVAKRGKVAAHYRELGGFVADGPVQYADIRSRYGDGDFRISAYSLTERKMLWEVISRVH